MMYEFRDTTAGASSEDIGHLPASAMMYDSKYIENVIEGYRTLVVTGREMISVDISSDAVKVGTKISEQRIQAREITVQYMLEDNDPEELQKKFKQLMALLYREEDVEISFNDDPQIFYYGRFSEADEVPGENNSVISSFTIYCQDPLRYSRTKEVGSQITLNSPVLTPPELITVRLARSTSVKITNTTTGAAVKITGAAIYANDVLKFDFDQGILLVNDKDMTHILDLESDFENFFIRKGDRLTCDNGTMAVYGREVYL